MNVTKSDRGFERIDWPVYAKDNTESMLVGVSSAIGDYEDSFQRPGSSYLWVGRDHHLNREQVEELVEHLKCWIATGKLSDITAEDLTRGQEA